MQCLQRIYFSWLMLIAISVFLIYSLLLPVLLVSLLACPSAWSTYQFPLEILIKRSAVESHRMFSSKANSLTSISAVKDVRKK